MWNELDSRGRGENGIRKVTDHAAYCGVQGAQKVAFGCMSLGDGYLWEKENLESLLQVLRGERMVEWKGWRLRREKIESFVLHETNGL